MAKQNGKQAEQGENMGAAEQMAAPAPGTNYMLVYRRDHPQNRSSYGIAGVSGIVVFDKGLFANGQPPPTITLDCLLADPKPDTKAAKAEAQAQRAIERAAKAQAKIEAAQAKAKEKADKAAAALAAALAKAEQTKAAAAATEETPAE